MFVFRKGVPHQVRTARYRRHPSVFYNLQPSLDPGVQGLSLFQNRLLPQRISKRQWNDEWTYFESFLTEGTSEMSMSVFRVSVNYRVEVIHSLLMVVNHLVSLCPLVQVPNVVGVALNAPAVRPNRLFELLHAAVRQANMVINVRLNTLQRFVLKCFLQFFYALLILLVRVVSQTECIQHLGIVRVLKQCSVQISGALVVVFEVVVRCRSVLQEFDIGLFIIFLHELVEGRVVVLKSLVMHFHSMVALTETI